MELLSRVIGKKQEELDANRFYHAKCLLADNPAVHEVRLTVQKEVIDEKETELDNLRYKTAMALLRS